MLNSSIAFVGYYVAAYTIDLPYIGRRRMQVTTPPRPLPHISWFASRTTGLLACTPARPCIFHRGTSTIPASGDAEMTLSLDPDHLTAAVHLEILQASVTILPHASSAAV